MFIGMAQAPYEGYRLYRVWHKREGRWQAVLFRSDVDRFTLQYAKYLLCVAYGRRLSRDETVDHINGMKTDDRIENLQVLSLRDNIRKSSKPKTMIHLCCPECGVQFERQKRYVKYKHTYCSRRCAWDSQRINRGVAQLAEQAVHTRQVAGSCPAPATKLSNPVA